MKISNEPTPYLLLKANKQHRAAQIQKRIFSGITVKPVFSLTLLLSDIISDNRTPSLAQGDIIIFLQKPQGLSLIHI